MAKFLIIAIHDDEVIGTRPVLYYGDAKETGENVRILRDYGYYYEVHKLTAPLPTEALDRLVSNVE
jgi:hypothetical protein